MKQTLLSFLLLFGSAGCLFGQTPILVVPTGHSSSLMSFMASADGKYFLTLGGDDLIKLWNEEGKEIRTIRTPEFAYSDVQLSPDNKFILASHTYVKTEAWILDLASEKVIYTLDAHTAPLHHAIWSPDGKMIATCSADSTVILWDARNGTALRRLSGHTGAVVSAVFSSEGNRIATLGKDTIARVWESTTGRLLWTFRPGGDLPSQVQFSPDGNLLSVCTGLDKNGISLWSVETGKKVRVIDGYSLRFSPDGKWISIFNLGRADLYPSDKLEEPPVRTLRATPAPSDGPMVVDAQGGCFLPDSKAMLLNSFGGAPEIHDIETGRLKFSLEGYALPVQQASFSPDGTRILIGSENQLLEWDLAQVRLSKLGPGADGEITNVRYSPDGQKIVAVTDRFTGVIHEANNGKVIRLLDPVYGMWPLPSYVEILAISPDSRYCVRGHSYGTYDGPPSLSIWRLEDGRRIDSLYFADLAEDVAISPNGKTIAVANSNSVAVWDVGTRKWSILTEDQVLRYESIAFLDDNRIVCGTSQGKVEFWDLPEKKRILQEPLPNPEWSYTGTVACSPDKRWVASSLSKKIGLWRCEPDQPPQFIQAMEGHDNLLWSVAFSPDSRWIVSSSFDNTVRIWDVEKRTEVARLIHLNSTDWAITTPSGLFDASPGAMELMYFILGDELIELEQLKERYYEPGLLPKLLGFAAGELRNVEQFQNLALYPKIEANIEQNKLTVNLLPKNGGIGKLSLFVNGKEVAEDVNPQRLLVLNLDLKTWEKYYRADTINTISLRAYNADGWLKSQAYKMSYQYVRAKGQGDTGAAPALGDAKPRLFALVVGTADYSGDKLDLKYADQDAAAISTAITAAGKELFGEGVQVQLFTTGNSGEQPASAQIASKINIEKAFEALTGQTRATDILLLYFSGHGITYGDAEKAQFYYLTKDVASEDLSDPEVRNNFTISSNELTEWIKRIPALKQVLILDACNSGKIVESLATIGQKDLNPSQVRALDRMKDRTGMFILTGSAADKVSYEASQFGQGLLTYSLLEGMSGLALAAEKRVDVMTLFQYSRDKVPEMAKSINGIQTPMLAFPANGGSFDIGIVNEKVKIPLAQVKPVFIRNNFQDEDAFEDVLGLTDALEQHFRKMTSKGAQSKIIYVDVKEYENAYSMKGRYSLKDNAVEVRARLFKGKTMVGEEWKATGAKDDMPGLVRAILEQVMPLVK